MKPQKLTVVLAAALFLSLSVNFFLAGLMLGDAVAPAVSSDTHKDKPAASSREQRRAEWQKREEALHAALGAADRAVMKESKEAYDAIFEELRSGLDDARAKVAAAMEAEPLDQEVLDEEIASEAAIKSRLLQEMTAARQKTMEQLSPEGRALLRQMMPMRRGGGKPPTTEHGGKPLRLENGHRLPHTGRAMMPPPEASQPEEAIPEETSQPPHEDMEPPPPALP
jgi:Spy/CpxP family protein refolding chaperone